MHVEEGWIKPAKIVLTVVWVVSLACVLSPAAFPAGLATAGKWTFWIMLAAHVVELFALWLPYTRDAPGSPGMHVLQVLLFGVVHGRAMRAAVDRAPAQ
jgi:uncharacterized protein YhhL (DUF1145 family)